MQRGSWGQYSTEAWCGISCRTGRLQPVGLFSDGAVFKRSKIMTHAVLVSRIISKADHAPREHAPRYRFGFLELG